MSTHRYDRPLSQAWWQAPWRSPAFRGIDKDLTQLTTDVAAIADATANDSAVVRWSGILEKPDFAAVAFSGRYADLIDAPSGGGASSWADITGKPSFAAVATSGAYSDLSGRPAIPDVSGLAPKMNPTFTGTVTGVTKAHVGLGNVDNTADSAKSFTASQLTSGVVARARLGSGTADATTILHGDATWKTPAFAASVITSGVIQTGRLGTGTASATTFLAGDGSWKTPPSGGSGTGTDITIRQNADGTWPTVSSRVTGAHYRWFMAYDDNKPITLAAGAQTGDEMVGTNGTTVIA